jgi:hypothetical protein
MIAGDAASRAVELDADSACAAGMPGYVELTSGADLPRATILLEPTDRLGPLVARDRDPRVELLPDNY